MKDYLLTLFFVCLVSAIVKTVSPDGAMKKYIEILCTVCVISAVIIPISTEISSLDGISDILKPDIGIEDANYDEIYNKYLLEQNIENAEACLEGELCQRLALESGALNVRLSVESDGEQLKVTSAQVVLGLKSMSANPDVIKEYILERTECECEIIYDNIDE